MSGKEALLGVLGGMGPEATEVFYHQLIRRTKAKGDQDHLRVLIFGDATVPERTAAILNGDGERVARRLAEDAKLLAAAGCTHLAMTCNAAHAFAHAIESAVDIPLLHMPKLAVARAKARGVRSLALLGTEGMVASGVYQDLCARAGISCWTPDKDTQTWVTTLIYDQIKAGQRGEPALFARVDGAVRQAGCDGAVLACTELSVYRAHHGADPFYIDAMEALVEECITACGKEPVPEVTP